jgi:hypothetical protein
LCSTCSLFPTPDPTDSLVSERPPYDGNDNRHAGQEARCESDKRNLQSSHFDRLVAGFGTAFGVRNTEHVSEVQTAAVCERHY